MKKQKELIEVLEKKLKSAINFHRKAGRLNLIDYSLGKTTGSIQAYDTVLLWLEDFKKELVLEEKKHEWKRYKVGENSFWSKKSL